MNEWKKDCKEMDERQALAREKRRQMMLEDPMRRVIPKVAVPMIVSTLIDSLYNLADTFFVSQLGKSATAAVAVNDSLMNILRAVGMGFAIGASSYISRLMGAKKDDRASSVGSTTLIVGFIFSALFAAVCLTFREPLVMLLGITEDAKQYSMDYAFWILLAAPFTTAGVIMNQLLRSEGSTTYAMIGTTSGCILNCILDPLFIRTFGWGVGGAAAATALSKVVSCCVLVAPYVRHTAMLTLSPKLFKLEKENIVEVGRMGLPAFLRMSLMSVGGIITNNVAKGFGTAALAAISIGNKLTKFVDSAIMGFSQGFGPVAGFCWGAKRYKRVKEAYFTTLIIGALCGTVLGTLMMIFAKDLIGVFNSESDPEVLHIGALKIYGACLAIIPHMTVMVTSNLYQSLGRPVGNLVLSMSRQLLVLIPLVLTLPRIFGAEGLAVVQGVSDGVAFLFLALPLAIYMLRKIGRLNDGDESPFASDKRVHGEG